MKKNGRLVAIALGSVLCASCVGGAFLVAGTTPAAETVRAADSESKSITVTRGDIEISGNLDGKSSKSFSEFEKDGVIFAGRVINNDPASNNYIFMNGNDFIYNKTAPEGYYLSAISVSYQKGGSGSSKCFFNFSSSVLNSYTSTGTSHQSDPGNEYSISNENESAAYGNISCDPSTNKKVQFSSITFEFCKSLTASVDYNYIEIEGEPSKTKYIVGDTFLTDGLSVVAYSSTDESAPGKDVTSQATWEVETFTDDDVSDNYETVVMASVDGFEDAIASYIVSVGEPATVLSLSVSGIDTEKTYSAGDIVDLSQAKITAHMSDGSDYDATYDLALEPYTITLEDAYKGSVEFPLEFKGVTTSIVLSTELSNIESVRVASKGAKVSTKGLVTGKFSHSGGYSIFIEDEGHAIMLYGVPTTLSESVAVGDIIAASGSKTDYKGLAEIEDVDGLYIASTGNEANPTIIDDVTSSALTDWDSRYIQVSGLTKNSGNLWTGSRRNTLVVKHSSGTIGFYCSNDQIAEDLQYQLDDFFAKIDNLSFTFTGHVGWFNSDAQLNPTSIDEFSCPDYDAVMAFINAYMHPDVDQSDAGDGKSCLEWYPAAKAALEALTETQRNFFLTSDTTAAYANRYNNWAKAYGEGATSSLGTIMSSNDTAAIIALVAFSSATVAAAGFMIASRRRKAK